MLAEEKIVPMKVFTSRARREKLQKAERTETVVLGLSDSGARLRRHFCSSVSIVLSSCSSGQSTGRSDICHCRRRFSTFDIDAGKVCAAEGKTMLSGACGGGGGHGLDDIIMCP